MKDVNLSPLCVDLDHTLIRTDLLFETFVLLLKRAPSAVLAIPGWLLRGRTRLKHELARRVQPDVKFLPFRTELLAFLKSEKERGRHLILISAADRLLVESVQEHLGIFDEVIGSDLNRNVKGVEKARLLEERFGKSGFDYVGDSRSDFAVWRSAGRAFVVTDSRRFASAVETIVPVAKIFPRSVGRLASLSRAARLHQWSKNLLVFVPIVTAHKVFDQVVLFRGLLAFVSFSFVCSAVYLTNDILDLEADRQHGTKRLRPIAAGEISILSAFVWSSMFLLGGLLIGAVCGIFFVCILAIYCVANVAYSLWFKRIVMLDVVVLSCFYSLRLLGGGAATGIGCSEWLLAFSIFLFFCLAMVKRYSELRPAAEDNDRTRPGRGYLPNDLDTVASFGIGSGLISVLVLVLYVMSPEVRVLYPHPAVLLFFCPLFLYWIARVWLKARRGEIPDDPVVFALKDATSYIVGALAILVLYLATF